MIFVSTRTSNSVAVPAPAAKNEKNITAATSQATGKKKRDGERAENKKKKVHFWVVYMFV